MNEIEEKSSYEQLYESLERFLNVIKRDHNRDYFCCLMDSPEEFFKYYPELHGYPSHSIYAGESGESLEKAVNRSWRDKHLYWLERLFKKRKEEKNV